MWQLEDNVNRKTAHFRLLSMTQKHLIMSQLGHVGFVFPLNYRYAWKFYSILTFRELNLITFSINICIIIVFFCWGTHLLSVNRYSRAKISDQRWCCASGIIMEKVYHWGFAHSKRKKNSFASFAHAFFIFVHFTTVLVLSMIWNDLFAVARRKLHTSH